MRISGGGRIVGRERRLQEMRRSHDTNEVERATLRSAACHEEGSHDNVSEYTARGSYAALRDGQAP